mgnify:CR=1 FL=1
MLVLSSVTPILAHYFLSQMSVIVLFAIWVISAVFAYGIRNVIVRYNFALPESNHSFAISLALFSPFFTCLYAELGTDPIVYLVQAFGILCMVNLIAMVWQQKICPVPLMFVGAIIGLESTYTDYVILWFLLMPAILYIMRSWSGQNFGSIITGYLLALWCVFVFNFFVFDENTARRGIYSLIIFIENLFLYQINYSIIGWVFFAFTALLIIIYYIYGYFYNSAKTVRTHSMVVTFSVLAVLLAVFAAIDVTHLPNYAALISIIFGFQISIHQSCNKDASVDWLIILWLLVYLILSGFMPFLLLLY